MKTLVLEYTLFSPTLTGIIDTEAREGGCVHYFVADGSELVDATIPAEASTAVQVALLRANIVGVSNGHGMTYTLRPADHHDEVLEIVRDTLDELHIFGPDTVVSLRGVVNARVGAHAA